MKNYFWHFLKAAKRAGIFLKTTKTHGIICLIKSKLNSSEEYITIKRKDCLHSMKLRIPSSDVLTYWQVFWNKEYEFMVENSPKVIVDAGANIGLASIYFSNRYPDAVIISLEPEESNFKLLMENTASYPNIIPVQAALWDRNEYINVIDKGLGKWGFVTESEENLINRDRVCNGVIGMTVDKIMEDFKLTHIDVFKIDIEGAEKEVFANSSAWIDKVSSIIIELHESMKAGCNRSFYCGTNNFEGEWRQGENVCLTKGQYLRPSGRVERII